MPTYEFISEDGHVIEEMYRISTCPNTIRRNGMRYKRAAASRQNPTSISAAVATTVHGYPRVDFTLPKGDVGGGVDPNGRPIIKSQAHERELIAQSEGRMRRD